MKKETFLSSEYSVDYDGNVYGKHGKILKPSKNTKGYYIVNFIINNKRIGVSVHTLIARAFCDGYRFGLVVNHKDGNKSNNHADNLEWVTPSQNMRHSVDILGNFLGGCNPNARCVVAIDKRTGIIRHKFCSLIDAAHYIISIDKKCHNPRSVQNSIYKACRGFKKSYKGYIWAYNDEYIHINI